MRCVGAAAVLLALCAAPVGASIAVDTCSQAEHRPRPRIEILPFRASGTTCELTSARDGYGETCGLQDVDYRRADAIYRVRLNPGNRVAFHLAEGAGADHVLALVRGCEQGAGDAECVAASLDFIGSEDETIAARSYPAGVYNLFVDAAADGACGDYTLRVTGTNPTPDLRLALTASPQPVVAGTPLNLDLSLSNAGDLAASAVEVDLLLPAGVALPPLLPGGCRREAARRLRCALGTLAEGAVERLELALPVDPAARGVLSTRAQAVAVEGEPTPVVTAESRIRAVTDLRLGKAAVPGPVIAGCPLVYRLTVVNRGPSTATGVVITDDLPGAVAPVAAPPAVPGCPPPPACAAEESCSPAGPGRVVCELGTLAPGAPAAEVCLPVLVRPDAPGSLDNRAAVAGAPDEEDPPPGNRAGVTTGVVRQTDLAVTKRALGTTAGVLRGGSLVYRVTVGNGGPSDSTGAQVRDALPAGVTFVSSADPCAPEGGEVVCTLAPRAGGEAVVAFTAAVDPEVAARTFVNRARVVAADPDPEPGNDLSAPVAVRVAADLRLGDGGVVLEPPQVAAGANLMVTLEVANDGPSDAPSAAARVVVRGGEPRLLASPDGCAPEEGPDADLSVVCPLPPIPAGATARSRFVLRVGAGAAAGEEVALDARVTVPDGKDPEPGNDAGAAAATVVTRADLAVDAAATPEPVATGGALTTAVTVSNAGPSGAADVRLRSCRPPLVAVVGTLPPGCVHVPPGAPCPGELPCPGRQVCCRLERVTAGEERRLELTLRAPLAAGTVDHELAATSPTPDPEPGDGRAVVTSRVVPEGAAVLALSLSDAADPVVAGDPARFVATVEHRGPAEAPVDGASVLLSLAGPVAGLLQMPEGCVATTVGALSCPLGRLERGASRRLPLTAATAREAAASGDGELVLTARLEPACVGACAGGEVATATEATSLVAAPDLLLPFFRADAAPGGRAALLAVQSREPGPAGLSVELGYLSPAGATLGGETRGLAGRGVLTRNLRDVEALFPEAAATASGSVAVDLAEPAEAPRERRLTGDVLHAGPDAAGIRLVDTGTARVPRQLCRRWSTRVAGLGGGTEFHLRTVGPAAPGEIRGRVYSDAGELVEILVLADPGEAFELGSGELLVRSGAVEWELPAGVVGHASTVHHTRRGGSAGVPGVCLDGGHLRQPGREHPLLLPYFSTADGPDRLTVRNEGDAAVAVELRHVPAAGEGPALVERCTLAPRAVLGVVAGAASGDPRCTGVAEGGEALELTSGYVEVRAVAEDPAAAVFLSGDHLRLPPQGDDGPAAGAALVDTDPERVPPGLCRRWLTRLLDGGGFGGETVYVFHLPGAAVGTPVRGEAHDEAGTPLGTVRLPAPGVAFEVGSGDLGLGVPGAARFGSVAWTLPDDHPGHVSALHRTADGRTALLPGACLEP